MKMLTFILAGSLMTSAAFAGTPRIIASEGQSIAERMNEVLKLQREIGKLEAQIQGLKEKIDSDKTVRNTTLIIGGALLVATAAIIHDGNEGDLGDLGFALLLGARTGSAVIVLGGVGAYKQYKISLSRDQLSALQARLAKIQSHLDAKVEEIKNSDR